MSENEEVLKRCLDKMTPEAREAFLRVLEWMSEQPSVLTKQQIVNLVHSQMLDAEVNRLLDG